MSHILKTCLLLVMRTHLLLFLFEGVHIWHNDCLRRKIIVKVRNCYDLGVKSQGGIYFKSILRNSASYFLKMTMLI